MMRNYWLDKAREDARAYWDECEIVFKQNKYPRLSRYYRRLRLTVKPVALLQPPPLTPKYDLTLSNIVLKENPE